MVRAVKRIFGRKRRRKSPAEERPRVLVVGAGFGGLWTVRELAGEPVEVLLIDQNNYHAFWPLLYQIGAGELEATGIAYPVRTILRGDPHSHFLMAAAEELDPERKVLQAGGRELPYDILVLALGSASHYFDIPGARKHTFPLKTLDDGLQLRNQILSRFEMALQEPDPERRRQLLTFVIVGGGPTGVEYAGALMELIRTPFRKDYPELDFDEVSVILLEALDNLLPGFEPSLAKYAEKRLRRMGVDVRLGATVSAVTPDEVCLKDGTRITADTVVWSAGVKGHPLAEKWGLPTTEKGTVEVEPTLQVKGHPDIYVLGDLAHLEQDGKPIPMLAAVATRQAKTAARNILHQIRGEPLEKFVYSNPGMMAAIGRNKGVAQIKGRTFTGFLAWALWAVVHVGQLIGFRNKLIVLINWGSDYLFYERAIRLVIRFHEVRDVVAEAEAEAEERDEEMDQLPTPVEEEWEDAAVENAQTQEKAERRRAEG